MCLTLPKLRTYNLIADFDSPKVYLTKPLTFSQRRSLARLRLGSLRLRIETGRYERPQKAGEERICQQCTLDIVESEAHFVLECPKYDNLRSNLLDQISNEFFNLDKFEKLSYLLNNADMVKKTSQFINYAMDNRIIH